MDIRVEWRDRESTYGSTLFQNVFTYSVEHGVLTLKGRSGAVMIVTDRGRNGENRQGQLRSTRLIPLEVIGAVDVYEQ